MNAALVWTGALALYIAAVLVPGEWFWFDPGLPIFEDSAAGTDPALRFSREIKRKTTMRYAVFLRRNAMDDPACDAEGGPFEYLPSRSGALVGWTLSRWAPSDPRCAILPVGSYYGSVTWTITNPYRDLLPEALRPVLGGLLAIIPPKSITREIPVFNMTEAE